MTNLNRIRFFRSMILSSVNLWKSHSRRRRQKKAPCSSCGRTLINQRLLSPMQLIFGGWTCLGCGHAHSERRGRQTATLTAIQPAE